MGTTLYGRGPALEALRGCLTAARAGRGRLAVISGEAGIGKSALVELVAAEAEASGAVVSRGRAWEFADAPPYFPVRACLRGLGVRAERDAGGPSDAGSFQLWEDVVAELARAASAAVQVWVLEDLHAADLGTLDLLTFLAQPLRSLRAVVLATARPHDPRLADRASQRLARMARDGADVRLERLGPRELASLAEATAGRPLPPDALARLADVTGGNPLFVIECARLLRSEGAWTPDAAPANVRHVVLERCGLLPESARRALVSGAILGRSFSAASVARMHHLLPAQVIDALLPALRADLITELRPGQFQFSHALVRDALEASLEEEPRAALHALAEEALAALGDAPEVLMERARHALAGARRGGDARAVELVARAGAALEREGALDRAYELYARADDARASGLLPPATGDERLHLAAVARLAGRGDTSRRVCQEVAARARADGDPALLARAALLEGADLRPGVIDRGLVAHLEEALGALSALDGDTRGLACRVEARLAAALQPAANPEVPMAMARRALATARELGDDGLLLEVLEVAGSALVDYAPPEERRALSEELLTRALRAGDGPKALRAQARAALDQMELGDFDAFERTADAMLALSDEVGHPRHRWRALLVASCRALTLGYFAESERHVSEASQLGGLTDDPALPLALCAHRALRVRLTRHDDELPAALADLESTMSGVPQAELVAALVRATCFARVEDAGATRRELTLIGASSAGLTTDRALHAWLAEAYVAARALLATARTADVVGGHIPFTYEGTVARLLGLLDLALGDTASAERNLAEARALAAQRRHASWVAQLDYERGKAARRAGREVDARALFSAAAAAAAELGMTGLTGAARRQLERVEAATAATTTPAPTPASGGIESAREGELWRFSRGATTVRIRTSRGAELLSRLLERPGEEIHVLALASDEPGRREAGDATAGELLDERARASYRARVVSLDEDLAEAERCADVGRAAQLSREHEALLAELARAVGLGGRARHAGSASERARVNVQRRLRDTIARIAEQDADLGRALNISVKTGIYCCFRP